MRCVRVEHPHLADAVHRKPAARGGPADGRGRWAVDDAVGATPVSCDVRAQPGHTFAQVRIAGGGRGARRSLPSAGEGSFHQVAWHRAHRLRSVAIRGRRRRSGRFTKVTALSSQIPAARRRGEAKWPVNAYRLSNDCARKYGEIAQVALAGRIDGVGPFPVSIGKRALTPRTASRLNGGESTRPTGP